MKRETIESSENAKRLPHYRIHFEYENVYYLLTIAIDDLDQDHYDDMYDFWFSSNGFDFEVTINKRNGGTLTDLYINVYEKDSDDVIETIKGFYWSFMDLKVGSKVKYCDPKIYDYDPQDRIEQLNTIWEIVKIDGDIFTIVNENSETETEIAFLCNTDMFLTCKVD